MESDVLHEILEEVKRTSVKVNELDTKIENFLGFFELTEGELAELEKIRKDVKAGNCRELDEFAAKLKHR